MRILLALVACLAVTHVAHAVSYTDLMGVWTTQTADSGTLCRYDIQFFVREFSMFTTGPQCTLLGPWFGTYAIDGDDVWVQWVYMPANLNKVQVERMTTALNGNHMMFTLGAGSGDAHTISLIKANGTNYDGVWNGLTSVGGQARFRLLADLFEMYPNVGAIGMGALFGYITNLNGGSLNDATMANMTFAYAPNSMLGLLQAPATIGWNTSFANQIIMTMQQPVQQTISFSQKIGKSALDGVFVGSNGNCFDTFEIITGLFKHYVTGCPNVTNNLFLSGLFDIINSTHIQLIPGFSSNLDFPWLGVSKLFAYKLNTNSGPAKTNQLSLNGYLDGFPSTIGNDNVTGTSINSPFTVFGISNPPLATTATLTLAADLASFTQSVEDNLLTSLSQALGLNRANINILSKASGSVILNMLLQDDQVLGKYAKDAAQTLEGLTNIGGFPVSSVAFSSSGGNVVHASTGTVYVGSTGNVIPITATGHNAAAKTASTATAFASVTALLIAALLL